jgi:hypothetical protein
MNDGQREVSMDKDHEVPSIKPCNRNVPKKRKSSARKTERARARERERERRFIHYLTSICTVLHTRSRHLGFVPRYFILSRPFCIHVHQFSSIQSRVSFSPLGFSVCVQRALYAFWWEGEEEKNAWLWRCAFRLSALFAHAGLSNILSLSSDPCCRLH